MFAVYLGLPEVIFSNNQNLIHMAYIQSVINILLCMCMETAARAYVKSIIAWGKARCCISLMSPLSAVLLHLSIYCTSWSSDYLDLPNCSICGEQAIEPFLLIVWKNSADFSVYNVTHGSINRAVWFWFLLFTQLTVHDSYSIVDPPPSGYWICMFNSHQILYIGFVKLNESTGQE